VLFPTPPFPDATAINFFTLEIDTGLFIEIGGCFGNFEFLLKIFGPKLMC